MGTFYRGPLKFEQGKVLLRNLCSRQRITTPQYASTEMNTKFSHLRKRAGPIVWLLISLLVIFPVAQHAWAGIVLCIGMDGHVELEDGRYSDCATEVGKAADETHYGHAVTELDYGDFEECGPCVDLALLASPIDGQVASKINDIEAPGITLQKSNTSFLPAEQLTSTLHHDSALSAPLPFYAPLRTIALLI